MRRPGGKCRSRPGRGQGAGESGGCRASVGEMRQGRSSLTAPLGLCIMRFAGWESSAPWWQRWGERRRRCRRSFAARSSPRSSRHRPRCTIHMLAVDMLVAWISVAGVLAWLFKAGASHGAGLPAVVGRTEDRHARRSSCLLRDPTRR